MNKRRCPLHCRLEKGLIFWNQFLDKFTLTGSFENSKKYETFFPPSFPVMFREGFQQGPTARTSGPRQRQQIHKQKSTEQKWTAESLIEERIQRCENKYIVIARVELEAVVGDGVNQTGITLFSRPLVAKDYFHHQQILPLNKVWLSCTKRGQKGHMWVQVFWSSCPRPQSTSEHQD